MLTIFAVPKPFDGHIAMIQRNAMRSWARLEPRPEVILFGNEAGIAETARELDFRHVGEVEVNEFGTPLMDDIYLKAHAMAGNDLLCFINSDIVLMRDFMQAVERVRPVGRFLMVGRRRDLDLGSAIIFDDPDWGSILRNKVEAEGVLQDVRAIDYFVFPRGVYEEIPPFAVGRCVSDNWSIYHARAERIPVIDATQVVMAVHLNHDYSHHPDGFQGTRTGIESERNRELAGGQKHVFNLMDADRRLTPAGLQRHMPNRETLKIAFIRAEVLHPRLAPLVRFIRRMRHTLSR